MTSILSPKAREILERLETRRDTRAPAELSSSEQVQLTVEAALEKKAEFLKVLELAEVSDFTDHFLICSGTNERQVKAIADSIQGLLIQAKIKPLHVEGYLHGRWVLLDYGGDMVIHVFHREARSFYDLERLWSDAPDVTQRYLGQATVAEATAS
ncbi:MAG: ribosome silencing factor [Acidobacteriota bacterium]